MKRPGRIDRKTRLSRSSRLAPVNRERRAKREARYKAFLSSPAWKALRKAALERAGHRCEQMVEYVRVYGLRTGDLTIATARCPETTKLHVHHLTYARFGGRELPEDLQVLCRYHHADAEAAHPTRRRGRAA